MIRLGLTGGIGSGKTTIAKLLSGVLPCSRGSITFNGKEMNELDIKSEIFYHFRFMGFQKSGRILHTNTWRNIDQLIENYEYIGPLTDY